MGHEERNRTSAILAYKMAKKGNTTRTIAAYVGCKPERIKAMVKRGERLASLLPDDETPPREPSGDR